MATSNYTFVYFELVPSSGKSYILFLLFSSTHYGTLWAILTQRLQQQEEDVYETVVVMENECLYVFCHPLLATSFPALICCLSYTNKYGTTHSMHTNTHICAPAAHSLSKFSFTMTCKADILTSLWERVWVEVSGKMGAITELWHL